jgi:hypothetical protein
VVKSANPTTWPFCGEDHSLSVGVDVKEGRLQRNDKIKFSKSKARHHSSPRL